MNEIKQIIISRIRDIHQLRDSVIGNSVDSVTKYNIITNCKRIEKIRSIRQSQILTVLNAHSLTVSKHIQDFYNATVQICSTYDSKYSKFIEKFSVSMKENIKKLYFSFFSEHGFRDRAKQVNQILEGQINYISPSLLYGWLSQWSKKIYCEIIQRQFRQEMNKKKAQIQQSRISKFERRISTMSPSKVALISQNSTFQKYKPITNTSIFIHNKQNVYGYCLEQLNQYYKGLPIGDLDYSYFKSIRKQGKKQSLFQQNNIKQVVDVILSTPANTQIRNSVISYQQNYRKWKPIKILSNKKHQGYSLSICTNKKTKKQATQGNPQGNYNSKSKLLSPKLAQFDFFSQEKQVQANAKKLKFLIGPNTKKYNVEFPKISKKLKGNISALFPQVSISKKIMRQRQKESQKSNLTAGDSVDMTILKCQRISTQALYKKKDDNNNLKRNQSDLFEDENQLREQLRQALEKQINDQFYGKFGKKFNKEDLKRQKFKEIKLEPPQVQIM